MFKLIVIAIVVYLVWKKLNASNKQRVMDKIDQVRSGNVNAPAAINAVKERSRCILVKVLIVVIGMLTGILKELIGSESSNLPTIRK